MSSILIAIPSYKYAEPDFLSCLVNLIGTWRDCFTGLDLKVMTVSGCDIISARASHIDAFIDQKEHKYLLFIDDDMNFPMAQYKTVDGKEEIAFHPLLRLLKRDKDVVGYAYTGRKLPIYNCVARALPNGSWKALDVIDVLPGTEPFPVDGIGFGFTLIKRHVIEDLYNFIGKSATRLFEKLPVWRDRKFTRKAITSIVSAEAPIEEKVLAIQEYYEKVDDRQGRTSDDYEFCQKVRMLGYEVWCDPTIEITHIGKKGYGIRDLMALTKDNADTILMSKEGKEILKKQIGEAEALIRTRDEETANAGNPERHPIRLDG